MGQGLPAAVIAVDGDRKPSFEITGVLRAQEILAVAPARTLAGRVPANVIEVVVQ